MSDDISRLHGHHLPGRLRVRVPALRSDESLSRVLLQALRAKSGIDHVDIRAASGSVVLHYDPDKISASSLVAFVKGITPHDDDQPEAALAGTAAGALLASMPPLPKTVVHLGRVFGQTAFKVALQRVVETGLSSALRTVAVRG